MLMKCICGFVKPTTGEVIINNEVIGRDADYIKDAGGIHEKKDNVNAGIIDVGIRYSSLRQTN